MTNREVLAKFLKQAFNFEIKDSFNIGCHNVYCSSFTECDKCPGKENFWDEEFISDKPMTFSQYVANLESNVKYMDGYGRVLNPITNTKPVNFFKDLKKETEEIEETNETTAFTSGEISW